MNFVNHLFLFEIYMPFLFKKNTFIIDINVKRWFSKKLMVLVIPLHWTKQKTLPQQNDESKQRFNLIRFFQVCSRLRQISRFQKRSIKIICLRDDLIAILTYLKKYKIILQLLQTLDLYSNDFFMACANFVNAWGILWNYATG